MVRRHPATFIRIFNGLMSCSLPLLVNGDPQVCLIRPAFSGQFQTAIYGSSQSRV